MKEEEDGKINVEIKFIIWPLKWFINILVIAGHLGIIKEVPKWFGVKVIILFSRFFVIPIIKR